MCILISSASGFQLHPSFEIITNVTIEGTGSIDCRYIRTEKKDNKEVKQEGD